MKKESQADRAVRLINQLSHTKGPFAGKSFDLRPWQAKIVRKLFTTRKDGLRQYRTCLLMLPRKNGKSELAAALAIYFLLFDGEIGAEVYSAAADKDQAALVFNVAAQMIRNDQAALEEEFGPIEIIDSTKRIVHRRSGSFYRAISAEAYSKHGFNASVVIYDELHAAPNRELWDVLSTSQSARAQPLMMAITTAGYDRRSILWELYSHAQKVAEDPSLDPTFLPLLFEAPIGADWQSEKVWRAANPALGDFRSLEEMRTAAARARLIPAQENTFRRLYLNQWTEQETRAISSETWKANNGHAIDASDLLGRTCYGGLDLASVSDLTAWVLVFPCEHTPGAWDVLPRFWVPEAQLQRGKHSELYRRWKADGLLETTPGEATDHEFVKAAVLKDAQRFNLIDMNIDQLFQGRDVGQYLAANGVAVFPLPQTTRSFGATTIEVFKMLAEGRLHHGDNPIMAWMAASLVMRPDSEGNQKPDRVNSQDKVDGMVAMWMAFERSSRHVEQASDVDLVFA